MPRQSRIWYPGAVYHVMGRGIRRQSICNSDADYQCFRATLLVAEQKYKFKVYAYCVMTNHFHMLIATKDVSISRIMWFFMNQYAKTFNHLYGYKGHVFDARYVSRIIEDDHYLVEVSRYIHLNPVKAMMVREPLDYPYSSYMSLVSNIEDEILYEKGVLHFFRGNAREGYRKYVEARVSYEEEELLIQKDMGENELWLPW